MRTDLSLLLALLGSALFSGCSSSDDDDGNGGLPQAALFDGYGTASASLPVLATMTPLAPLAPAPSITQFSVSPSLPAGIALDTATGVLSGAPTALSAPQIYSIRATNGSGEDIETITLEVRAPVVALSSDRPLVRTTLVAGTPATPAAGGVAATGLAPALTSLAVTVVDGATTLSNSAAAALTAPALAADPIQMAFDATVDFTATIDVDDSELSADPWILAARAPYDTTPLAPALGGFPLDTSVVALVDGELQLDVSLAAPSFGPFESTALPTSVAEVAPLSTEFQSLSSDWRLLDGLYYFEADLTGGGLDLFRFDPALGNIEQVVDLVPGADLVSNATVVAAGIYFVALDAGGFTKPYFYDPVADQADQIGDTNPGAFDSPSSPVELDGAIYYVANDVNGRHLYRYTPADGPTPAASERISFTTGNPNDTENPSRLVVANGRLYYIARGAIGIDLHLFEFDPTTATQTRLSLDQNAPVNGLVEVGGEIYVVANNALGARKAFRYEAGELVQLPDTSGDPATDDSPGLLAVGSRLALVASDASGNSKLFIHDPAGTPSFFQASDIVSGGDDEIVELAASSTHLFLAGFDAAFNTKLFTYEWATAELRQVVDVNGPGASDAPCGFHVLGDGTLALAFDSLAAGGFSIFVYDPVAQTTHLLADPGGSGFDDDMLVITEDANHGLVLTGRSSGGGILVYSVD